MTSNNGLGIVIGVLAGIIAGTVITVVERRVSQGRTERLWLGYLRYEINLNIQKIDGWLQELQRYRNAVNASDLADYAGYFDLSRFLMVTANNLLNAGLLYKHLSYQHIGSLQAAAGELSIFWENYMNNQINENRAQFVQSKAAREVNFWEQKFNQHKSALQDIVAKLSK